jgi:hypothetical protein
VPKANLLEMPKSNEHKNGDSPRHLSPATIIQLAPDAEEESASIGKIEKWLKLADTVLQEKAA